ncbi:hypothetical protein GCM10025864_02370 [Luteimicrobium album]|uniref:Uncharacterized protein n=1 Tax=Luteimicrobium album TaxID=1054550 RepID=A0ABQ6HXR9_9MICO|nr:hypothetical protein [Luteimicrobium album]GMA22478.1 hypothetical protein GCM10025864_02370 [Luteimicrobium album]
MDPSEPTVPRRRVSTAVVVALAALLAAVIAIPVLVAVSLRPADGDRLARDLADRVVVGIADDVATDGRAADAERLAQEATTDPRLPSDVPDATYEVAPLAWSGRTDDADGARVDLTVAVDVPGTSATAVFGKSRSAGSTRACWRLVVHPGQDVADHHRIACPDGTPTATPSPAPLPTFPATTERDVRAALEALPAEVSGPAAQDALAARFAAPLTVRVAREGDELVAAVGLTTTLDCVVGVRAGDGTARTFTGFDRALLAPGEVGCAPSLYLAPVTTH